MLIQIDRTNYPLYKTCRREIDLLDFLHTLGEVHWLDQPQSASVYREFRFPYPVRGDIDQGGHRLGLWFVGGVEIYKKL